jgi:hypothetical protein
VAKKVLGRWVHYFEFGDVVSGTVTLTRKGVEVSVGLTTWPDDPSAERFISWAEFDEARAAVMEGRP